MPWFAAIAAWLALAAVTIDPGLAGSARHELRWMLEPLFHDWHVVRAGWSAELAGIDALAVPSQPFNYPRAVLLGAHLGGLRIPAGAAGLFSAAALLAGLVWLLAPRSRWDALLATAFVVSPPVLLLMERGNLDAWAFLLVLAGLALLTRPNANRGVIWAGVATVAVAAFIKLYPAIVLLGAVVAWRGARRAALAAGLAVLGAWAAFNFGEIALILQKTTRGLEPAYGRMIAGSRTYVELIAPHSPGASDGRALRNLMLVSLAGCIGAYALAALGGWRWRGRMAAAMPGERSRAFFWSGALIYSGTFLLGSNWSYRLVFLLFCVPALWRATHAVGLRTGAWLALGGIVVMLLSPFHLPFGWFLLHEVVAWSLAVALLGGAVAALRPQLTGRSDGTSKAP